MLTYNFREIGNRLLHFRKLRGMTQAEIAESAGLSERTYADIERGNVNMRTETMLQICRVLDITPNDILTEEHDGHVIHTEELIERFNRCSPNQKKTVIELVDVYLRSINIE